MHHVLEHLHELVVKEVHGSGGYGMLVGPASTMAQRAEYGADIVPLINGGAELDESLDRRLACGPKRGAQVRQAGRPALQSRE
jgi:hypothetical protein